MKKNILVDMSATLLHHGHIRLLKKASKLGRVIVALAQDKEIKKYKGYFPELKFKYRKEILEAIKFVEKVIPSPYFITSQFLEKNKINYLIHGQDNQNIINKKKIIILKRTVNISTSEIRKKVIKNYKKHVSSKK